MAVTGTSQCISPAAPAPLQKPKREDTREEDDAAKHPVSAKQEPVIITVLPWEVQFAEEVVVESEPEKRVIKCQLCRVSVQNKALSMLSHANNRWVSIDVLIVSRPNQLHDSPGTCAVE